MLSDDSSSDSETGRFKCRTKSQDDQTNRQKEAHSRPSERTRHTGNDLRREFDRKRDERGNYSRDRHRHNIRHSPVSRRHSRERSPYSRRSHERHRWNKDSRGRSKEHRSSSRDMHRRSKSRSNRPPHLKRDLKDEIKHNLAGDKSSDKLKRKSREKTSSPPVKGKLSVVLKAPPPPPPSRKRKSKSPIIIEDLVDTEHSEVVQPGSYYKMIPAVVKDKSEESTEIDSSDDEKLRAKLLNLEKELNKTKKKRHRKKNKRKSSKSSKERENYVTTTVEVSSTTDIEDKSKTDNKKMDIAVEVSSTQKNTQKESSEEGEISSDDDSQNNVDIDPNDLRHKLRRSTKRDNSQETRSSNDVCGPALPPHLQRPYKKSPGSGGPSLPPHLQRKTNIGPSIPDEMRKTLAENDREIIVYESSDDDGGIGPIPVGADSKSEAQRRLEERALEMKIKRLDGHSLHDSKVKSREQWMLELPEGKAKYLGLEARSFRAKQGPDMSDRSTWTDTPEDKARKAAGHVKEEDPDEVLKREAKARHIAGRDDEQEAAVKKHKKKYKREESLLEMHQKKLKKKKKKEEREDGKKERRPFSRDVDLQANRFDEAQKKSIVKKAQELNTRFSRGEAKFL